jgi:hypothetical protein
MEVCFPRDLRTCSMSEHDPETWKPVLARDKREALAGDHAQTKGRDHDPVQASWIMIKFSVGMDQYCVTGSQGGTTYGSEANAPTSGARMQPRPLL